jgi:hypothetical protein
MHAIERPAANGARARVGRRAALTAAGLTLCCGGAALVPFGIKKAVDTTSEDLQNAFDAGRQAVLNELQSLEVEGETIGLDAALQAAEVTRMGVKIILLPVAHVQSFVTGHALDGVIAAISSARGLLEHFGQDLGWLDSCHDVLVSWREGIDQLPVTLDKYSSTDINGAERYLKALKAQVEHSKHSSATPTKTPTNM